MFLNQRGTTYGVLNYFHLLMVNVLASHPCSKSYFLKMSPNGSIYREKKCGGQNRALRHTTYKQCQARCICAKSHCHASSSQI